MAASLEVATNSHVSGIATIIKFMRSTPIVSIVSCGNVGDSQVKSLVEFARSVCLCIIFLIACIHTI